ncbi:MAG: hypothetical protein ACTSUP_09450 [Candidatus Heimdallarchaeaceae archaeon]
MLKIKIHLYGKLRSLAEDSGCTDDSIIELVWKEDETLVNLVNKRLNLSFDEIGEIFINHKPVTEFNIIIPSEARIALFAQGMYLLCGGQHLKGHGFIEKKGKEVNYW